MNRREFFFTATAIPLLQSKPETIRVVLPTTFEMDMRSHVEAARDYSLALKRAWEAHLKTNGEAVRAKDCGGIG